MLGSLRWVATHYVAPLSTVLSRCAPPNIPRAKPKAALSEVDVPIGPLTAWGERQMRSGRTRPGYVLSADPLPETLSAVGPILASGRNVVVTAPTVVEVADVAERLRRALGKRVLTATSHDSAAVRTAAWTKLARGTGSLVIGTREVAFWGANDLGLALVLDEGRRGYKSPQTPTYSVRDVLRRRSTIERFPLLLTGAVPTSEAVAAGPEMIRARRRIWPLVEVVDRSAEHESHGIITESVRRAIAGSGEAATVLVLVPRRRTSYRCARCRTLRRCPTCDAMLERDGHCPRCNASSSACGHCGGTKFEALGAGVRRIVEDLGRIFGSDVGPTGSGRRISVGTERDLAGLTPVDLVIVVDPDAWILAPNYRAGEDALRLLVRAVLAAKPGRGRRAVVQTSIPDHPVFDTLRSGDPMPFMTCVIARREETGFPPVGELIALETDAPDAHAILADAASEAALLGPASDGVRQRWLIQGNDLARTRLRLRSAVGRLRDGGFRVRVDADPIDL
jgi:primosomal protein N' (replication factor Y)